MTYSGVGSVVPSMRAASSNATSQNATRRGTAGPRRAAAGDGSRQSTQGRSRVRAVAMLSPDAWWWRPTATGASPSATVGDNPTMADQRGRVCTADRQPHYRLAGILNGERDPQRRPSSDGASHLDGPRERVNAVGEADESGTVAWVGSSATVVADREHEDSVARRDGDMHSGGLRVLRGIRERF